MCTVSLSISDGFYLSVCFHKNDDEIFTFNGCVLPHNSCFTMAVNSSYIFFSFLAT